MEAHTPLRIFFFPFPAMGHMIPLINMSKLFSRRGVSVTTVTTSGNEAFVRRALANSPVDLILVPLPEMPPNSKEIFSHSKTNQSEQTLLGTAVFKLKTPFQDVLRRCRPDCVVIDGIFPWSASVAAPFEIPTVIFNVLTVFSTSVVENIMATDESREVLATKGLPHRIEIARTDLAALLSVAALSKAAGVSEDAQGKRFGTLFNTFYEIEKEYIDDYRKSHRVWCVGPVSLLNSADSGKLDRHTEECLNWLDAVEVERSVIYVCFGSMYDFSVEQMRDIAAGLEASGHPFLWVVGENFEGFEVSADVNGYLVRGWVCQDRILSHPAIGGFVTHCGSNSVLEGATAGLPMVTWPLTYDQFLNEKLVTDVAKIGTSADRGRKLGEAVGIVMGSEGMEMSRRAREYGVKAKEAMEVGGSSYEDVTSLIDELRKHIAGKEDGAK